MIKVVAIINHFSELLVVLHACIQLLVYHAQLLILLLLLLQSFNLSLIVINHFVAIG